MAKTLIDVGLKPTYGQRRAVCGSGGECPAPEGVS